MVKGIRPAGTVECRPKKPGRGCGKDYWCQTWHRHKQEGCWMSLKSAGVWISAHVESVLWILSYGRFAVRYMLLVLWMMSFFMLRIPWQHATITAALQQCIARYCRASCPRWHVGTKTWWVLRAEAESAMYCYLLFFCHLLFLNKVVHFYVHTVTLKERSTTNQPLWSPECSACRVVCEGWIGLSRV